MELPPDNLMPQKSWASSHRFLIYLFLVVAIAAAASLYYYWQAGTEATWDPILPQHKDATSDWKTHTNTEYGFEVKSPQQYAVAKRETNNSGPSLYKDIFEINLGSDSYIEIRVLTDKMSLEDIRSENKHLTGWPDKSFTVGGKQAVQWRDYGNADYYRVTYVFGNDTFDITYFGQDNQANLELYDQVLSSFKFTP